MRSRRPRLRHRRLLLLATGAASLLLLSSCGTPEPQDTDPVVEPDDPDEDTTTEDGTDPDHEAADDADPGGDTGTDDGAADDAVERLAGEPTTERSEREGDGGTDLSVVEVRVGAHEGFDRVTFELAGEGEVGWWIEPDDEPRAQGSGAPIEVAGSTTLVVALQPLPYPDEGQGLQAPDRVAAPDDAVTLTEVVQGTLFEGQHRFIIGLDGPTAYLVDRLEDPQRVVVDLVPAD
jgi:hypothetical protein